jgi:hypothetical protein
MMIGQLQVGCHLEKKAIKRQCDNQVAASMVAFSPSHPAIPDWTRHQILPRRRYSFSRDGTEIFSSCDVFLE